jgi:hypothetical protein
VWFFTMLIHSLKAAARMKRKHYPLVTILGAICFTAVPVLILSVSLNAPDNIPLSENQSTARSNDHFVVSPPSSQATPSVADAAASFVPQEKVGDNKGMEQRSPSAAGAQAASLPMVVAAEIQSVPLLPEASELQAPSLADSGLMDASTDQVEGDVMPVIEEASPVLEVVVETEPEMPSRSAVEDTYYQATGHLAMANQPHVSDSGTGSISRPNSSQSAKSDGSRSSSDAKTRKGKKTSKTKAEESEKAVDDGVPMTAGQGDGAPLPMVTGAETEDVAVVIEDVAIQSPLENRVVNRVEDVVAMTGAKGWPVALIKSDLPDDVWWVQHMVGIQGNSFSARVNFGNEHSIAGTQYHLVFVFLDSADEVRRFRIAKQFEEIPKGVRRSREFLYIRN